MLRPASQTSLVAPVNNSNQSVKLGKVAAPINLNDDEWDVGSKEKAQTVGVEVATINGPSNSKVAPTAIGK